LWNPTPSQYACERMGPAGSFGSGMQAETGVRTAFGWWSSAVSRWSSHSTPCECVLGGDCSARPSSRFAFWLWDLFGSRLVGRAPALSLVYLGGQRLQQLRRWVRVRLPRVAVKHGHPKQQKHNVSPAGGSPRGVAPSKPESQLAFPVCSHLHSSAAYRPCSTVHARCFRVHPFCSRPAKRLCRISSRIWWSLGLLQLTVAIWPPWQLRYEKLHRKSKPGSRAGGPPAEYVCSTCQGSVSVQPVRDRY